MILWRQLLAAVGVGLIWGCTNPLTRLGSLQLQRKQQGGTSASGDGLIGTAKSVLSTQLLIVPQASSDRYIAAHQIHSWLSYAIVHVLHRPFNISDYAACTGPPFCTILCRHSTSRVASHSPRC